MNTFGERLKITTFGESHGEGIGCVVDGLPAGLEIDEAFIEFAMLRRAPGRNLYATQRKEKDKVRILSGVFEGKSTGTPIGLWIANEAKKSSDYDSVKNLFRPSHADFTYFQKYGIRDYRGGGRASARESVARVAAGAIAQLLLKEFGIEIKSGISGIGEIKSQLEFERLDFEFAKSSEIYALDKDLEEAQKQCIESVRKAHDSIGGEAVICAFGLPSGLGEPLYHKLDGTLGAALLGLNAIKAVEIGTGVNASAKKGSENNDQMSQQGFLSNHSGGVLGGISNGERLDIRVHFKPTPSIFLPQRSVDIHAREQTCLIKGRHDPCVAVRGSVVAEAMVACVVADMLLLNATSKLESLKRVYGAL